MIMYIVQGLVVSMDRGRFGFFFSFSAKTPEFIFPSPYILVLLVSGFYAYSYDSPVMFVSTYFLS